MYILIVLVFIWAIYISACVDNHRQRLKILEKDKNEKA